MTIRLTFPIKSHQMEDLRPLYEEFKANNPALFAEWRSIEERDTLGRDDLKEIQYKIYDFLKARTEWESYPALTSAFADFRRLIVRDAD